jgi:hypothetical protein
MLPGSVTTQAMRLLEPLELARRCQQVVLFGSRAAGAARRYSDWDVLCVGERRQRQREVDAVWLSPTDIGTRRWLGSELAGHIARYGVWLIGEDDWSSKVFRSRAAVDRKRRLIQRRDSVGKATWRLLSSAYREQLATSFRRDLQRLEYLCEGRAVPATPVLDKEWAETTDLLSRMLALADRLRLHQQVTAQFLPQSVRSSQGSLRTLSRS